ncbi:MAG: hypothetical protein ABSE48_19420, partial [Verrucomicrobiota bacterium]
YGLGLFAEAGNGGFFANTAGIAVSRWFNNGGWLINGPVTNSGTYYGKGSGLTSLNGSQVTSGTVPAAQLPLAPISISSTASILPLYLRLFRNWIAHFGSEQSTLFMLSGMINTTTTQ